MTAAPDKGTLITMFVLSVVMVILFAYNTKQTSDDRAHYRDARSLRAALMAVLLFMGVTVILIGRLSLFFPQDDYMRAVLRVAGAILIGAILTIGAALVISHWLEGRRR